MPKPWTTVFPTPTHWDDRFAEAGYFYGTEPNDFLRSVADRIRQGASSAVDHFPHQRAYFLKGLFWLWLLCVSR